MVREKTNLLPDWYKNYILANGILDGQNVILRSMHDRPYEFVYNAIKLRPDLLNIINDNYLYCLTDPAIYMR